MSGSGAPIYPHEPDEGEFDLAIGDAELIGAVDEHVAAHVGHVETVFHEIVSDLVHVDALATAPATGRDWWTLVTCGMSQRPTTTRPEYDGPLFAELVLCLPPASQLSEDALHDERNYGPVRLLKTLARLPHERETWLGIGHTVANEDPPQPYTADTRLCCALLLPRLPTPDRFDELSLDDGTTIRFLSVVPLYEEEIQLSSTGEATPSLRSSRSTT